MSLLRSLMKLFFFHLCPLKRCSVSCAFLLSYNTILESYQLKTLDVIAAATIDEAAAFEANPWPHPRRLARTSIFRNSTTGLFHAMVQKQRPQDRDGRTDYSALADDERNRLQRCIQHLRQVMMDNNNSSAGTISELQAEEEYDRLWKQPPLTDNPLHHNNCGRHRFSEPGFHRIIKFVSIEKCCVVCTFRFQ